MSSSFFNSAALRRVVGLNSVFKEGHSILDVLNLIISNSSGQVLFKNFMIFFSRTSSLTVVFLLYFILHNDLPTNMFKEVFSLT